MEKYIGILENGIEQGKIEARVRNRRYKLQLCKIVDPILIRIIVG